MPFGPLVHRRRALWLLLLPVLAGLLARADDAPPAARAPAPLTIVFVTSRLVVAENFTSAPAVASWLKSALTAAEALRAATAGGPELLIQIVLTPDAPPRFEFAGRQPLPAPLVTALQERLTALPDLRSGLTPVCVRLQTSAGTASPLTEAGLFTPRLLPPAEAEFDRFLTADLATQCRAIRAWSQHYALPLLAHRAATADPQFAGAVATGRALAHLPRNDDPIPVERLTYNSADYWRGVMEMAPGDQLVTALPAFLFAADGRLDQTSTLLGVLTSFSRDGNLARELVNELAARIGPFRRQLGDAVQAGVDLHEQGRYDEAIARHEQTLAAYPGSAWARYERFFSTVTRNGLDTRKKLKKANKLWDEVAPEVYRCNPLYNAQFGATRGVSASAVLDRLVLHRLANKPPENFGERLGGFADVALRLGDYGTAALIYWSAITNNESLQGLSFLDDRPVTLTKEDVLARYLYCLEKLGVPEWKGEFEGDFGPAFRQLDASLAAHRGR